MIPTVYSNLEVRGANTRGQGTMIVPVLAGLMAVLHGFFADHPGSCALDFPHLKTGNPNKPALLGRVVRVFSDTPEHCNALLETIEQHPVLSQYIMTGRVRSVPHSHSGPWVSLHRVRVAPRSQPHNRRRDLENQQARPAPFLRIYSGSTKQRFSLMLERRSYPRTLRVTTGALNTYGLSGDRPFYLPDLPV